MITFEDAIEEIAMQVRLGNLAVVERLLTESLFYEFEIARGRARAATLKRGDDPLPPLSSDPLQDIAAYNKTPRQTSKKRRAA